MKTCRQLGNRGFDARSKYKIMTTSFVTEEKREKAVVKP